MSYPNVDFSPMRPPRSPFRPPTSSTYDSFDYDTPEAHYDSPDPDSQRHYSSIELNVKDSDSGIEKHAGVSDRRSRRAGGTNAEGAPNGDGRRSTRKQRIILIAVIAVIIIAVAAAVPAAILSKKKDTSSGHHYTGVVVTEAATTAPAGVPTGVSGADWKTAAVGGDQSVIYADDGSSFIYNNSFGGFWNAIPFNDSARAQSDVPSLEEPWDYNLNLIQGVNLGGWLLIEPFITPALFEPYNTGPEVNFNATVVDEWTLSLALGSDLATTLENHYATFITEKDFAEIAGAGLNWVRIPLPYWAIEVWDGEPFLPNVAWTYFLKAITWARKYGIRINLDLHAVPGSQNGNNHSSKLGTVNFLNGTMGIANAQRTLNYIRTLAEFISQDQYRNVVPMFSILNEPSAPTIGVDVLRHFYIEAYKIIRDITGYGEGNGPIITFHDGFVVQSTDVAAGGWNGFLGGSDRVAMDSHSYLCFSNLTTHDSLNYDATKPCAYWGAKYNQTTADFGISIGGEWSLAVNDCGKWVNSIGNGNRYEGTYYYPGNTTAPLNAPVGNCSDWNDWQSYNASMKAGLQQVANAHFDALRHWFFWTWKTGFSNDLGMIANPLWNYQLGLENGYVPANPRLFENTCAAVCKADSVSLASVPAPSLSAWMTGGSGAGTLLSTASAQVSSYGAWPPLMLGGVNVTNFPTYTSTGAIITMTGEPTPTSYPSGYSTATTNPGDGWVDSHDKSGWNVEVAGCTYPNPWYGVVAPVPTAPCKGGSKKMIKRNPLPAPIAVPTTPPRW